MEIIKHNNLPDYTTRLDNMLVLLRHATDIKDNQLWKLAFLGYMRILLEEINNLTESWKQ